MDFSRFFINRPIFAIVLSVIVFSLGLMQFLSFLRVSIQRSFPRVLWCAQRIPANPKEIATEVAEPRKRPSMVPKVSCT